MDLRAVVMLVASLFSLAFGVLFVAGAAILWRRDKSASALARFGLAKGFVQLAEAVIFGWLAFSGGSSGFTLPLAFAVFVGGGAMLSWLAKKTRSSEDEAIGSEPGAI